MISLQLTGREGCSSGDGGPDCGRFLRGYRPEHPHFGIQKVTVLLRGRFLTMPDTTSQILPACKRPVWSVHNLIQTPAAPDPSTSKSGPRLFPKRWEYRLFSCVSPSDTRHSREEPL